MGTSKSHVVRRGLRESEAELLASQERIRYSIYGRDRKSFAICELLPFGTLYYYRGPGEKDYRLLNWHKLKGINLSDNCSLEEMFQLGNMS